MRISKSKSGWYIECTCGQYYWLREDCSECYSIFPREIINKRNQLNEVYTKYSFNDINPKSIDFSEKKIPFKPFKKNLGR